MGLLRVLASCALASACASPSVRLDETGAAGHRAQAARAAAAAELHRRQFDPEAAVPRQPIERMEAGVPVMDDRTVGSNPTAWHLSEANRHAAHAQAHASAALALERFEASECVQIAAHERNACPILSGVAAVTPSTRGVRIDLLPGTKLPKMLARMRCHLAYARSVGFERAASCPLYLRGVDILPSADGRAIEVVGDRPAAVEEIRHSVGEVALHPH